MQVLLWSCLPRACINVEAFKKSKVPSPACPVYEACWQHDWQLFVRPQLRVLQIRSSCLLDFDDFINTQTQLLAIEIAIKQDTN